MDCVKTGALIRRLRLERALTQKQLAEAIMVSDKAVSKWERGMGLPDISLLSAIAAMFKIDVELLLDGEISEEDAVIGNMKKTKYYVCPTCGNISLCTGEAQISCCGRKLEPLTAQKASDENKLSIEKIEGEWFVSSKHEMTKAHYISFIAFATGDRVQIVKLYPEWNMQARLNTGAHGTLLWYCTADGLFYQLV